MSAENMDDPIKILLNSTGWSCEDLLKKLQNYKNDRSSPTTVTNNPETDNINNPPITDEHVFKKPAIPPVRLSKTHCLENRRKLKLLHLRKTKLIRKYRNRYRGNKCKEPEYEYDNDIDTESQKDEDEVRSQIKMQLELLRNRKKDTPISTLCTSKDVINRTTPDSWKKRLTNGENVAEKDTAEDFSGSNEEAATSSKLDDVLLSNDSGIIIVNVVGGYKSPPPEETEEPEIETTTDANSCETAAGTIKLTKTNNITRIKGWRTKNFILPQTTSTNPPKLLSYDDSVPSCSNVGNYISETEEDEENTSTKSKQNPKSAFVSNALDEFLNEHSKLNISYEVPKLEAEQGITQNFTDTSLPKVSDVQPENETEALLIPKRVEPYKPKTLAEKRKLLQKDENTYLKNDKPIAEATKVVAEKKQDKQKVIYCPIYYGGRTIRLRVRAPRKTPFYAKKLVHPRETNKRYKYVPFKNDVKRQIKRKPSLLNSLRKEESNTVHYKPGPMCMKKNLQDSWSAKHWKTVVKKLPAMFLEVTPAFRKALDPRILHLLDFGGPSITTDRLEFAMAAVQSNDSTAKVFKFPVPYTHDQKFILMREPVSSIPQMERSFCIEEITSEEDTVKLVLKQLLDAIEISELSDSLIKYDETATQLEDTDVSKPISPISKNIDAILKCPKRLSKTSLELRRLNVKIIDVEIAAREEVGVCDKPFCSLGCVCGSLECKPSISLHCRQETCMFECSCSFGRQKSSEENTVKLPAGMDLLSARTLNHLQDEAKKDLAPVEREFTQTVIQANDQTIVLGGGRRSRQKRLARTPSKYNDFLDVSVLNCLKDGPHKVQKEMEYERNLLLKCVGQDIRDRVCYVSLVRMKLDDVIPFCLVHNLYDCYCKCTATFQINNTQLHQKISPFAVKKQPDNSNKSEQKEAKKVQVVETSNLESEEVTKKQLQKPWTSKEHCSRSIPVDTKKYKIRNSHPEYIPWLKRALKDKEKQLKSEMEAEETTADTETEQIDSRNVINRHKRKQDLKVRDDIDGWVEPIANKKRREDVLKTNTLPVIEKSTRKEVMQNKNRNEGNKMTLKNKPGECIEKGKPKQNANSTTLNKASLSIKNLIDFEASKKDLFQPTHLLKKEFLHLLGKKVDCQAKFRLLPWSVLALKYEHGSLQLWYCPIDPSAQIIVTENLERPSPSHINIDYFKTVVNKSSIRVDIIRWLVTKTGPKYKDPKNTLVVLAYQKLFWRIRGICEQNAKKKPDKLPISLMDTSIVDKEPPEPKPRDASNGLFEHTDVNDKVNLVSIIWEEFSHKTLTYESTHNRAIISPQILDVPLPNIDQTCKWYILQLKTGFSYILFTKNKNNYSIGHADLLKVTSMAQEEGKTLLFIPKELSNNYSHFRFGIYAVPDYDDKVFVGPYSADASHEIETLGYVKSVLVNTELYYKMRGQSQNRSGCWATQFCKKSPKTEKANTDGVISASGRSLLKNSVLAQAETSKRKLKIVKISKDAEDKRQTKSKEKVDRLIVSKSTSDSSDNSSDDLIIINDREILGKTHSTSNSKGKVCKKLPPDVSEETNDCSDDVIIVNGKDTTSEAVVCRRYFITNVPTLGYISAYQLKGTKVIDVKWPLHEHIRRYSKAEDAVPVLESQLSKILIAVPSTFRITVKLVNNVDLEDCQPLDPKYLSGNYIVGSFGIQDIQKVNAVVLRWYGLNNKEILAVMAKQSRMILYDCCCKLAEIFMPKEIIKTFKKASEILDMAAKEVKYQEKTHETLSKTKNALEMRRNKLLQDCLSLVNELPVAQQKSVKQTLTTVIYSGKSEKPDGFKENADELLLKITQPECLKRKRLADSVTQYKEKDKTDPSNASNEGIDANISNLKEKEVPIKVPPKNEQKDIRLRLVDLGKLTKPPAFVSTPQSNKTVAKSSANVPSENQEKPEDFLSPSTKKYIRIPISALAKGRMVTKNGIKLGISPSSVEKKQKPVDATKVSLMSTVVSSLQNNDRTPKTVSALKTSAVSSNASASASSTSIVKKAEGPEKSKRLQCVPIKHTLSENIYKRIMQGKSDPNKMVLLRRDKKPS